mmetsp:Transcript_59475/g.184509  ORF Transcript_59475/g.184509 Transcript_59475/m.184509 type:complete len:189 (-) Transcript_59475:107-673(-)
MLPPLLPPAQCLYVVTPTVHRSAQGAYHLKPGRMITGQHFWVKKGKEEGADHHNHYLYMNENGHWMVSKVNREGKFTADCLRTEKPLAKDAGMGARWEFWDRTASAWHPDDAIAIEKEPREAPAPPPLQPAQPRRLPPPLPPDIGGREADGQACPVADPAEPRTPDATLLSHFASADGEEAAAARAVP